MYDVLLSEWLVLNPTIQYYAEDRDDQHADLDSMNHSDEVDWVVHVLLQ